MRRLGLVTTMVLMLVLALPGLALAQDGPTVKDLSLAMDTVWVLVAAVLVLFMQAGFAMLEVGFSRMKNVGSVVAKILVNLAIAALLFWAFGFALAFGTGNAALRSGSWPYRRDRSTTCMPGSRGPRYRSRPSSSSR